MSQRRPDQLEITRTFSAGTRADRSFDTYTYLTDSVDLVNGSWYLSTGRVALPIFGKLARDDAVVDFIRQTERLDGIELFSMTKYTVLLGMWRGTSRVWDERGRQVEYNLGQLVLARASGDIASVLLANGDSLSR